MITHVVNMKTKKPMKTARLLFIFITCFSLQTCVFAATFTATSSGDWNLGATWGNPGDNTEGSGFPGTADDAEINGGITVTIPASFSATCNDLTLNADLSMSLASTLNFTNSTCSLTVEGNALMEQPGFLTGTATSTISINGGYMVIEGNLTMNAFEEGPRTYNQYIDLGTDGFLRVSQNWTTTEGGGFTGTNQIFTDNGTLELNGDITLFDSQADLDFNAGATVQFGKLGDQTLPVAASDWENIILAGKGIKSLSGNITVNQKLTIQDTATFNLDGNTLTYSDTCTLEYQGDTLQIAGDEVDSTSNLKHLVINNPEGVLLDTNKTVDSSITLTDGMLTIDNGDTLVLSSSGTISGGSAASYIAVTGNGQFQRTTSGATLYPVGTANYYCPVTLNPNADVRFDIDVSTTFSNTPPSANRVIQVEYNITPSAAPGNTDITIEWDQNQEAGGFQSFDGDVYLLHWNGATWDQYTSTYNENSPSAGRSHIVVNSYSGGFSPFSVMAGSIALPVELTELVAKQISSDEVEIHWQTCSEINNHYFEVQRSVNGIDFTAIKQIEGNGNSTECLDYSLVDKNLPSASTLYYRLKQVDFDGTFEYSNSVQASLDNDGLNQEIYLYPNPSHSGLVQLKISEGHQPSEIRILNSLGQLMYSTTNTNQRGSTISMDLSGLPAGWYTLQADVQGKQIAKQLYLD